jgi:NADPH-dependent curcumin reductase CurA
MADAAKQVMFTGGDVDELRVEQFSMTDLHPSPLSDGEVRVAVRHVSLDPYVRLRLRTLPVDKAVPGQAVGEVVESRSARLPVGTIVTGEMSWSTETTVSHERLTAVEVHAGIPLQHYVGLLGLSGITAYFGMCEVCRPRPGDRVVVSGAYGGVGQVAAQIAKLSGAKVLGIVSSADKRSRLAAMGVDAVVYRNPDWVSELRQWGPNGVDIYFDNVWGSISDTVVPEVRPNGLVAICGQISGYDETRIPPLDIDWYLLLTRSLTMRGFRAVDYLDRYPEARRRLAEWYLEGSVRQDLEVIDGLAAAADGFLRLLTRGTIGKATVAVS